MSINYSLSPSAEDFPLCYHLKFKKKITFKSMIYFEFIFVQGVRFRSSFIFKIYFNL